MSRIKERLLQYKQELQKQTQYKEGLPGSSLDIVNSLLNDLEEDEKENEWIPVNERMPEEHNSIFAKWKGTEHWSNAMFEKRSDEVLATVEYPDGTRVTEATYTIDGIWKMTAKALGGIVVSWKPFPEQDKEGR